MRRNIHLTARFVRKTLLTAISPLDRCVLLLNDKGNYPPIQLRRQNGPLSSFETAAGEMVAYLTCLAGLSPEHRVLDVGCGSGTLALVLEERLNAGLYKGFDVDRSVIRWCQKSLTSDRFEFSHHDYWNATFNRDGTKRLPWPVDDTWADVIVLKSVLTHILPEDIAFYLSEIKRVLRTDGKALVTAFALEGEDPQFPHGDGIYRYRRAASPESAIAVQKDWLTQCIEGAGLKFEFFPGYWRNDKRRALAYQDTFILSH